MSTSPKATADGADGADPSFRGESGTPTRPSFLVRCRQSHDRDAILLWPPPLNFAAMHLRPKCEVISCVYLESDNFVIAAIVRGKTPEALNMAAAQLTEEQEIWLADMIEQARERAKRTWKTTSGISRATPDEAFDRGFEEAMDFAVSDEFGGFLTRLKSMLDENEQ